MTNGDLSAADLSATVRPGDVVAGKYRVERVLGAGGMGVVVLAHHLQLDQPVALKFLLSEALRNPETVARFDREARAAVRIQSEHVARVIDVGRLETGTPYMVMEYLDGQDLSAWLAQRGPMPVEQAVDFVLQACEAIANAHVLGIVHRDLKPANLFCIRRPDGQLSIKVLDFGISKVTTPGGTDVAMTRTAAIIGSPLYMSPEQMQSSKGVDARTDLWSLGVILFELLTGRTPFHAEAVTELVIKIAVEPAPFARAFRADLPPSLEHTIARCLEKERQRRFQNVGELAVALSEFGSRRSRASVERVVETLHAAGMGAAPPGHLEGPPASTGPRSGAVPPPSWGDSGVATWGKTGGAPPPPPRSWTGAVVASVAGVVAIAVVVGVVVASRAHAPPLPPSTATQAPAVEASSLPSAAPPPSAEPPPGPTVTAGPTVMAASAQPTAQRRIVPLTLPSATAASSAVHPTTTKAACDPPYFIDPAGHRQYKPACL